MQDLQVKLQQLLKATQVELHSGKEKKRVEGENEEQAASSMEAAFKENI